MKRKPSPARPPSSEQEREIEHDLSLLADGLRISDVLEVVLSASDASGVIVRVADIEAAFSVEQRKAVESALTVLTQQGSLKRVAVLGVRLAGELAAHLAVPWHQHVFGKECRDEVRGRFDVVEDDLGAIVVLDVGMGSIVQRCSSREEAVAAAKVAAEAWDEDIRASRAQRKAWKDRSAALESAWQAMLKKYAIDYDDVTCFGMGWLPLLDEALARMVAAGWDRKLVQVKSKFCELRIYIENESPTIRAIIKQAAEKAAKACENCGKPHRLKVPRSGQAWCAKCDAEEKPLHWGSGL